MAEIPDFLQLGVLDAIRQMEREERSLTFHIRQSHRARFKSFREQLRRQFLSHFMLQAVGETTVQVWDPLKVVRSGLQEEATQALQATLTDVYVEDEQVYEDSLDDAFVTGQLRYLWLLAMAGISGLRYVNRIADRPDWGIDGIGSLDRLQRWHGHLQQKAGQLLRTDMLTSATLSDTLDHFDLQTGVFDGRVTGLLANERHRANRIGQLTVRDVVAQDVPLTEIWLTRRDTAVCPVCAALHLTITLLQPIDDTHPGCRCWKVPVPEDYVPTPFDYKDFLLSEVVSAFLNS